MPLPKPKEQEAEDKFMARCIEEMTIMGEGEDNKQRVAICSSIWEKNMDQNEIDKREKEKINNLRNVQGYGNMPEKETRTVQCEIRMAEDSENTLIGYAAKYNVWSSPLIGFRERIADGAFDRAIEEKQDVRALWNHDSNFILGRTKSGTLKLETDDIGLKVRISPPDTTWAKDLMSSIKRGDVNQMSFGFTVRDDKWWQEENTGEPLRELRDVDLFDVSPVTYPAYEQTEVFSSRDKIVMGAMRKAEHGFNLTKDEKEVIMQLINNSEPVDAGDDKEEQRSNRTVTEFAKQEIKRYEKIRRKYD